MLQTQKVVSVGFPLNQPKKGNPGLDWWLESVSRVISSKKVPSQKTSHPDRSLFDGKHPFVVGCCLVGTRRNAPPNHLGAFLITPQLPWPYHGGVEHRLLGADRGMCQIGGTTMGGFIMGGSPQKGDPRKNKLMPQSVSKEKDFGVLFFEGTRFWAG